MLQNWDWTVEHCALMGWRMNSAKTCSFFDVHAAQTTWRCYMERFVLWDALHGPLQRCTSRLRILFQGLRSFWVITSAVYGGWLVEWINVAFELDLCPRTVWQSLRGDKYPLFKVHYTFPAEMLKWFIKYHVSLERAYSRLCLSETPWNRQRRFL